jgi:hypothetical protein
MKDDKKEESGKTKKTSNDQDNTYDLIKKFKEADETRQKKLGDEMDEALGRK